MTWFGQAAYYCSACSQIVFRAQGLRLANCSGTPHTTRFGLACAIVLVVAWTLIRDVALGPSGWASRVIPLLLLGYLLGSAIDRVRHAEAERRRMEIAALMHREAIEINDSLIQRMAAAKWALEAGRTDSSEQILTEAMSDAQQLVSSLITRADMSQRAKPLTDLPMESTITR